MADGFTFSGSRWAASHQTSVNTILGTGTRKVSAKGSQFYNKDRWTARTLMASLVEHLRYGNAFDHDLVEKCVYRANDEQVYRPEIVVATVPDRVPAWLARASIGGNYHEAWHTEWSCSRDLTVAEVWGPLSERWDMVSDWTPFIGAVLTWGNIIEDIRIERLGCAKYPGSPDKMADLQDLILKMEAEGREASEHRGLPTNDDMAVVMGAFRDLGLGYTSERQLAALADYEKRSPAGWALVDSGLLRPLLDRAIHMAAEDDLDHWWLAMEIVATLVRIGKGAATPPPPPSPSSGSADEAEAGAPEGDGDGEGGKGKPPEFPVFKVGDRAKAKVGPYAGKVVEVTFAGVPTAEGRQDLRFAVVED